MIVDKRSIVITGFMGTGKSSIGQLLADELGRPFADMDSLIEMRASKTISEIFAQDGETVFRQIERQVLSDLVAEQGQVIATGGGALVSEENLILAEDSGLVICLDASPEALAERLEGDESRPLLQQGDTLTSIRTLLAARRSAYARIPWHIDTTKRSENEIVAQILSLWRGQPNSYHISSTAGDYAIVIADHITPNLPSLLQAHCGQGAVMIVSDENVWHYHGKAVEGELKTMDRPVHRLILPPGEQHKNLDTLSQLYEGFVAAGLDRSSTVVALGGGVITDMAGFAASTYMRGIGLIQMPTTLLGMVDASVGGKVAVDLPSGKNLVGAFVAPRLVAIDPALASTLDETQVQCGLAEIIKAGIIDDPELFERLEQGDAPLRWMVERALEVKIRIVQQDPQEHGLRAVLNLGHTFGHAFELLSNYTLPHGFAVSMGTATAARTAEIMGLCNSETCQRIENTLQRHNLPVRWQAESIKAVIQAMQSDKKTLKGVMRLVLPHDIGQVDLYSIDDLAVVRQALERSRA